MAGMQMPELPPVDSRGGQSQRPWVMSPGQLTHHLPLTELPWSGGLRCEGTASAGKSRSTHWDHHTQNFRLPTAACLLVISDCKICFSNCGLGSLLSSWRKSVCQVSLKKVWRLLACLKGGFQQPGARWWPEDWPKRELSNKSKTCKSTYTVKNKRISFEEHSGGWLINANGWTSQVLRVRECRLTSSGLHAQISSAALLLPAHRNDAFHCQPLRIHSA